MRNRRFLTAFLVVLPSAAVAGGVFAANVGSGEQTHQAQLSSSVVASPTPDGDLAIGDMVEEARLLNATTARLAAERRATEELAAQQAAQALDAKRAHALAQRIKLREAVNVRKAAAPAAAPAPAPTGDDVWARLRKCEAGGVYSRNSGNGYYGAYQFAAGTWRSLGYSGLPHEAPPEVQDEAARKLQARSGWGQWPACSRRIGAR
jgi:hypothetical protein